MKKIHATLETGFYNAYYEEWFEFEDDATEKEIEETIEDWEADIKSEMCATWEEEEEEEED